VSGSNAVTLAGFNALASSIEAWSGNGQAVLGTRAADTFDFGGITSLSGLAYVDGGKGNDWITDSSLADNVRGGAGNVVLFAVLQRQSGRRERRRRVLFQRGFRS
jgi:hypothetical protein